ncbi:MAG: hypothetical protein ACOCVH_02130 [Verrucomicrobiota bacterium]
MIKIRRNQTDPAVFELWTMNDHTGKEFLWVVVHEDFFLEGNMREVCKVSAGDELEIKMTAHEFLTAG